MRSIKFTELSESSPMNALLMIEVRSLYKERTPALAANIGVIRLSLRTSDMNAELG